MLPGTRIICIETVTYAIPNAADHWRTHIANDFHTDTHVGKTGADVVILARQALNVTMRAGFLPYSPADLITWCDINSCFTLGTEQDLTPIMVFCQIRLWATFLNDLILIGGMFPDKKFSEIILP